MWKFKKIEKNSQSLTSRYLSGEELIEMPSKRRTSSKKISIVGAKKNNINNVDFDIPLNSITCITGVSGSGKSTLIYDCFYGNAIRKMGSSFENPGFVKNRRVRKHKRNNYDDSRAHRKDR